MSTSNNTSQVNVTSNLTAPSAVSVLSSKVDRSSGLENPTMTINTSNDQLNFGTGLGNLGTTIKNTLIDNTEYKYYNGLANYVWPHYAPSVLSHNPWRTSTTDTKISLAIDLPGIRLNDLNVTIDDRILKVSGKRFDNNSSVMYVYTIPGIYDLKTVKANLDSGILTVEFSRLKDKVLHRVKVSKGRK